VQEGYKECRVPKCADCFSAFAGFVQCVCAPAVERIAVSSRVKECSLSLLALPSRRRPEEMASRTQTQTLQQQPSAAKHVSPLVNLHENYAPQDLSVSRGKGFPSIFKANPKEKQYTWQEVAEHNTGQTESNRLAQSLRMQCGSAINLFRGSHKLCLMCTYRAEASAWVYIGNQVRIMLCPHRG
jgi:hypothetical protein